MSGRVVLPPLLRRNGRLLAMILALAAATPAAAAPSAQFDWFDYRGSDPVNAAIPAGPGDYRNPILTGFYPDPSLTRVGDDYYLVNSTFAYFPGLPIFHSRDLVSWTQIGNAIDRPSQLKFDGLGLSRAVFAPSISERDGVFYILNTCVDCGGNFLITATDPKGPWSDPVWLPFEGIDPSFFFDDDGRAWILNNGAPEGTPQYDGHRAIWIQEFDLKAKRLIGPRKVLVNGGVDFSKKPIWIEGPHIFRRDGWYYLICAEGGTSEQHSQVVLRSRSVTGPYEPWSGNPILTQRGLPADRPFPITSAGHADFVETAAGEWWATFLATRPYSGDFYNTGRETFLLPVRWVDGWPVMTAPGATIPYVHPRPKLPVQPAPAVPTNGDFSLREEFDAPELAPYWMMLRNPKSRWYALDAPKGALTLQARPEALGARLNPSYLGRRQQNIDATATTRVQFTPAADGDRAGIAALQSDEYFYFLGVAREAGRTVVKVERRAGAGDPVHGVVLASAPVGAGRPIELRIEARGGRYDFAYAEAPGRWVTLLRDADGEMLSTKVAGGFVGVTIGMYAFSGQP